MVISVEVAYALPDKQVILEVAFDHNPTIKEAILTSCILKEFPEINLDDISVGVFSQRRTLEDILETGDRVEIYRPLTIDPKEARRARAISGI